MRPPRLPTPLAALALTALVMGVSACSDSRDDEELAPAPTSGTTTTTIATATTITIPVTARLATTTTVGPTFTLPLETTDPPETSARSDTVATTAPPPTTAAPTTARPTTAAPTTAAPTTAATPPPTTARPAPTTAVPNTAAPTAAPTTAAPTTAAPTTAAPTTAAPTTAAPTSTLPPVLYEAASPTPFDAGASAALDPAWIDGGGAITGPIADGRYWAAAVSAGGDTVTFRLSQVFVGDACAAQFPDPGACADGFEVLADPSGTLDMAVADADVVAVLDAADPPTTYTVEPAELVRLVAGEPPTGAPPGFAYADAPFFVTVESGRITRAEQVDTTNG